MPLVEINIRKNRTPDIKKKMVKQIHSALREALKIPARDINFRFHEFSNGNFVFPPTRSEMYTLIEISLFKGRSPEAKRLLYKKIVENLAELGIEPHDVFIVLHESEMENWGIRGGIPASEINLGFEVKV